MEEDQTSIEGRVSPVDAENDKDREEVTPQDDAVEDPSPDKEDKSVTFEEGLSEEVVNQNLKQKLQQTMSMESTASGMDNAGSEIPRTSSIGESVNTEDGYQSENESGEDSDVSGDRLRRKDDGGYEEDHEDEVESDVSSVRRHPGSEGYEEEDVEYSDDSGAEASEEEEEDEDEADDEENQEHGPEEDKENVIVEGEADDGASSADAKEVKVDDEAKEGEEKEGRKSPSFVPRRTEFWDHDDRFGEEIEGDTSTRRGGPGKKLWDRASNRWAHDMYKEEEQGPKEAWELEDSKRQQEFYSNRRQRPRGRARFGDFMRNARGEGAEEEQDDRERMSYRRGRSDRGRPRGYVGRGAARGRDRGRGYHEHRDSEEDLFDRQKRDFGRRNEDRWAGHQRENDGSRFDRQRNPRNREERGPSGEKERYKNARPEQMQPDLNRRSPQREKNDELRIDQWPKLTKDPEKDSRSNNNSWTDRQHDKRRDERENDRRRRPADLENDSDRRLRPADTEGDSDRRRRPADLEGDSERRRRPADIEDDYDRRRGQTDLEGGSDRRRPADLEFDSDRRRRPANTDGDLDRRRRPTDLEGETNRHRRTDDRKGEREVYRRDRPEDRNSNRGQDRDSRPQAERKQLNMEEEEQVARRKERADQQLERKHNRENNEPRGVRSASSPKTRVRGRGILADNRTRGNKTAEDFRKERPLRRDPTSRRPDGNERRRIQESSDEGVEEDEDVEEYYEASKPASKPKRYSSQRQKSLGKQENVEVKNEDPTSPEERPAGLQFNPQLLSYIEHQLQQQQIHQSKQEASADSGIRGEASATVQLLQQHILQMQQQVQQLQMQNVVLRRQQLEQEHQHHQQQHHQLFAAGMPQLGPMSQQGANLHGAPYRSTPGIGNVSLNTTALPPPGILFGMMQGLPHIQRPAPQPQQQIQEAPMVYPGENTPPQPMVVNQQITPEMYGPVQGGLFVPPPHMQQQPIQQAQPQPEENLEGNLPRKPRSAAIPIKPPPEVAR